MDGTAASLANREIGRVLPANYRKVPFSGAVEDLNEAATGRYFGDLSGDFIETGTSLTDRTGFEDYGFCQIRVRTPPPPLNSGSEIRRRDRRVQRPASTLK